MDIQFDSPDEDELKFILDSWTSSYRKSIYAGTVPNNLWQQVCRESIIQLVGRPNSKTIVALAPVEGIELWANAAIANPLFGGKPGTPIRGRLMGYAVAEPGLLHWLYVKKDFRRLGIGSCLLNAITLPWPNEAKKHPRFTHNTYGAQRFLPKWWKYDPIPARVQSAS